MKCLYGSALGAW
jgi:hypothetical protein